MWFIRSKKLLTVVVVLLAVGIILLVSLLHQPTIHRSAAVKISAQGFVPAELVIKVDTRVTWTNTDTKGHTVSANPYPSHSSFKALASMPISKGQKYSFAFTKAGTYRYHDDLHPTMNGTIIVQK